MTAEEKAIAFVRELQEELISYNHSGFYIINEVLGVAHKSFMRGYNEAIRRQSSPKIKQLEWAYDKSDEIYIAKLSMFEYRIWQDNNQSFMKVMINNNHCTIMRCITIDEAKAAAQADFEKRIKECLE